MPSIKGHTLLVIGGSSGIGFSVAKLALEEGMRVAIASSNPGRLATAAQRLKDAVGDDSKPILTYTVDLKNKDVESQIETLLTNVNKGFGSDDLLDHLVFTAGDKLPYIQTKDMDIEFAQACGMVRFIAPMFIGKLASRFIKNHWTSSITFTSGILAERPIPQLTAFAAYAAGLEGITRNLALDLKPIRVNQVTAGSVKTELWGEGAEARAVEVAKKSLLGKVGMPEDIAEAYLYLMKDITADGSIIHSNSGDLLF